ncbi:TonB family protein [Porticoccaceae bacterium LTM1]|nr:TonB family protein [Porticoccaceae bacterium LTM1]
MNAVSVFHWIDLLILRPTLIVVLIGTVVHLCRSQSASTRHWLMLCAFVCLPLIPLLNNLVPATPLQLLPASWGTQTDSGSTVSLSPLLSWIVSIYAAGVVLILIKLAADLTSVIRLRNNLSDVEDPSALEILSDLRGKLVISRHIQLKTTEQVMPPFAFGLRRPTVVLPVDILQRPTACITAVMAHELAHVKRFDWPTAVVGRIICSLFWFLPWVWWLWSWLEYLAENACDDQVLELNIPGYEYAEQLMAITQDRHCGFAVAAFKQRAGLYHRIRSLLDEQISHQPINGKVRTAITLIFTAMLVPLAALKATAIEEQAKKWLENISDYEWIILSKAAEPTPVPEVKSEPGSTTVEIKPITYIAPSELEPTIKVAASYSYNIEPSVTNPGLSKPSIALPTPEINQFPTQPQLPEPTHMVLPKYPYRAESLGIEGKVTVRYDVEADGSVSNVNIINATPANIFDKAALHAVRQMKYPPQNDHGTPVVFEGITNQIIFRMEEKNHRRR